MTAGVPSRLLAVLEDPAAGVSGEQASTVIKLAAELVKGNPVALAALELSGAMLSMRCAGGPPPGYLAVAGLDEVSWRELADRRRWLLAALAAAEPGGAGHEHVQGAPLALAAVLPELDARARTYAADPDSPRRCACGLECRGLAAMDDHLDQFRDLHDDAHEEVAWGQPRAAPVAVADDDVRAAADVDTPARL